MASYSWIYLTVLQLSVMAATMAVNPGMVSRITSRGLSFLQDVGVAKANEMAKGHSIPRQSGESSGVTYSVWNMEITSFGIPYLSLLPVPNQTLSVVVQINLAINGSFSYSCFLFGGDGDFDATLSDVSSSFDILIGNDGRGRPNVSASGCEFNAGDVVVNLHGQIGFISDEASSSLAGYLNDNACTQIMDTINTQLEQRLGKLTMLSKIYNGVELDYSLLGDPRVMDSSFDVKHKGEVYAIGHHSEAPGPIATIPDDPDESRMFYVWITDYLVNSAGYVLHYNSYLNYNVTQKDVPAGSRYSLNTSGFPLSIVFPQVRKLHPDMMTQFHISSTKPPSINTTREKITLAINFTVAAYVIDEKDSLEYLFTLGAQITTCFRIAMKHQNVTWVSTFDSVKLEVVKSAIGDVKIGMLKKFLPIVINTYINKMGAVGKRVPAFQDYHPKSTNITQGKGFLKIGTDLHGTSKPIEQSWEDILRALVFY